MADAVAPTAATLEVHLAVNHFVDTTAHLLFVDGEKGEKFYAEVAQGSAVQQATYWGHRWHVRGMPSGELLATHYVTADPLQLVIVGSTPPTGTTAAYRAAFSLGASATRESAMFASRCLLKLLGNIESRPNDPAVRTVRRSNQTISRLLQIPHVEDVLLAAGFAPANGGDVLTVQGALNQEALEHVRRLERSLKGLEGIYAPGSGQGGHGAGSASGAGDERLTSHTCASCRRGIDNDVRVRRRRGQQPTDGWGGGHEWNAQGEYRYHCTTCDTVDLCAQCFDAWKNGDASRHPLDHNITIEPPITTPWGGTGYGAAPAPPPLSARPRRGPWG